MSEFIYSTRNPAIPVAYSQCNAMHTQCEILLPGMAEDDARALVDDIWAMVAASDAAYNRFNPKSPLAAINLTAARETVEVDEEMFLLLELSETFRKSTLGWFDITANAASRLAERGLELDAARHTVRFAQDGIRLDMGGIAKGFVLEKAVKMASAATSSALISFGGSSTAAIGRHPLDAPWPVSVAHPFYADKPLKTFNLENNSLSVSGKDPSGRGHIIDPATGNIVSKDTMVAVTGASPLVTEVLSTALWLAPEADRKEILASFEGYDAWELLPLATGGVKENRLEPGGRYVSPSPGGRDLGRG